MTLEDLRVFIAVCDAGSISGAAQVLKVSQPAVSQHITRVEAEFGVPLLERRSRGVATTAAGAILYDSAVHSISELALVRDRLNALRAGKVGSLSLVTGGTTLKHFMQNTVVAFRETHPGIAIRFHQGNSTAHCLEALRKDPIDLGFVTMHGELRGIEQRAIVLMDHALLVKTGHPLANRKRITVEDLEGLELIGLSPNSMAFGALRDDLTSQGIAIKPTTIVDDWDLAYVLVRLGMGSAIVPSFHAQEFVAQGHVAAVLIKGLQPVRVGWAARRFDSLTRPALDFMELLEEELRRKQRPGVKLVAPVRKP